MQILPRSGERDQREGGGGDHARGMAPSTAPSRRSPSPCRRGRIELTLFRPRRHPHRRHRLRAAAQSDAGGDRRRARDRADCGQGPGRGDLAVRQGVQRQSDHRHRLDRAAGDRPARALRPPAARGGGDPRDEGGDGRAAADRLSAGPPGHRRARPDLDRRPSADGAAAGRADGARRGREAAWRARRGDGRAGQGLCRRDRQCRRVLRRGHLHRDRLDHPDPADAGDLRLSCWRRSSSAIWAIPTRDRRLPDPRRAAAAARPASLRRPARP